MTELDGGEDEARDAAGGDRVGAGEAAGGVAGGEAPGRGRGRWDRRVSEEARKESARRRLVEATALVVASRGATATAGEIIGLAGTGRNTFYEHFDGVDAAVSEVIRTAVRDLGNALHESTAETRAPRERIRSLATAWLAGTAKNPLATAVLLETVSEGRTLLLAELEKELRGALELGRTAGALSVATEPLRVACALGTFVAAATHVARTADVDLRAAADTLTDVTLRSFR